jgi:hypothetical protein
MLVKRARPELLVGFSLWATALVAGSSTTGCAPAPQTVANVSVGNTGCPANDLAVFNYDENTRGWHAACRDKYFVCSAVGGGTRCTPQETATLDPELVARSQLLFNLPKQKRDRFVASDILAGTWDSFAYEVAALGKLSDQQLENMQDQSVTLYTSFSAGFNEALKSCVGSDRVVEVWINNSGSFISYPDKRCLSELAVHPDLAFLRSEPGRRYVLATDVHGIVPLPRPAPNTVAAPAAQPAAAPVVDSASSVAPTDNQALSAKVRADLDAAASDILTCTASDKMAVKAHVDEQGKATFSLMGALSGSGEEGCVRAALGARTFAPGPLDVVHLVKAATQAAEPLTGAKANEPSENAKAPAASH